MHKSDGKFYMYVFDLCVWSDYPSCFLSLNHGLCRSMQVLLTYGVWVHRRQLRKYTTTTQHTHTHTVTHSIRPLWGGQRCRLYGNDAVRWLSGRQQRRCHESWGEKNLKTLTKKRTEKPVNLDAASVYQTRSESKHPENGDIFSCDLVCQSRALQRKQSILHYHPPALTLFISRLNKKTGEKERERALLLVVRVSLRAKYLRNKHNTSRKTHDWLILLFSLLSFRKKERKKDSRAWFIREGSSGPAGDQGSDG